MNMLAGLLIHGKIALQSLRTRIMKASPSELWIQQCAASSASRLAPAPSLRFEVLQHHVYHARRACPYSCNFHQRWDMHFRVLPAVRVPEVGGQARYMQCLTIPFPNQNRGRIIPKVELCGIEPRADTVTSHVETEAALRASSLRGAFFTPEGDFPVLDAPEFVASFRGFLRSPAGAALLCRPFLVSWDCIFGGD